MNESYKWEEKEISGTERYVRKLERCVKFQKMQIEELEHEYSVLSQKFNELLQEMEM